MIKVIFKNVGQGDSIIIEWQKNEQTQIAIIDCNLYQGENPILNHIIKYKFTEIEYLILSHPHSDHFSGFYQILEYCKNNSVHIKYFLHTSTQVPTFLKTAVKSASAANELQKLFHFLHNNFQQMNIKLGAIHADLPNNTIQLNENYSITILSPTQTEFNKYISGAIYPFNEENAHDNPSANWLCTLLKLNTPNGFILLTSDVDKTSLIRIDKKNPDEISDNLLLGQSPHHGAKGNHNNAFWKKRNRLNDTPVVFSVGTNPYNHPDKETAEFFHTNNYKILSTNKIGSLLKYDNIETLTALNMFSSIVIDKQDDLCGDKIFEFR